MDKYLIWIELNIGDNRGYGECHEKCLEMQVFFPELELRKGFYLSVFWGKRTHWWLRTDEGSIVDPTVGQFQDGAPYFPLKDESYEDLTDTTDEQLADRVPSGVCMECGNPVFHNNHFCGEACRLLTLCSMGID